MISRIHPPEPTWFSTHERTIRRKRRIQEWLLDSTRGLYGRLVWEYNDNFLERFSPLFDNKCIYCETLLEGDATARVSFFRPNGNARQERDNLLTSYSKDHYRWLSWEWSNFYLSCWECATSKAATFPVIEQKRANRGASRDELANEPILLIDPCNTAVNPLNYLSFQEDGTVQAVHPYGDQRANCGAVTIDVLDLNRETLVMFRATEIRLLRELWDAIVNDALKMQKTPGNVQKHIKELEQRCADKAQYAGMTRQLLYRWREEMPAEVEPWKGLLKRLEAWNRKHPQPRSQTHQASSVSRPLPQRFEQGYAMLVGVGGNQYDNRYALPITVNDAQALHAILCDQRRCAYPPDQIRLLSNETATRQGILDGLTWLAQSTTNKDATVIVFFSGHGWYDEQGDKYYLIPSDCNPKQAASTAIPADVFRRGINAIPAKKVLVLLDCCHAAGIARGKHLQAKAMGGLHQPKVIGGLQPIAAPLEFIQQLKDGEGRAIISSSRDEEESYIRQGDTNSIFTTELLSALTGAVHSSTDSPMVHLFGLIDYICQQVPERAKQLGAHQTPVVESSNVTNFPIAFLQRNRKSRSGKKHPPES